MKTAIAQSSHGADEWLPTSIRFGRINLPTRDLAQSRRFFTEVLGGEARQDGLTIRVHFSKFDVELGRQDGGATAPDREYPHYAFTVPADQFVPLKRRLEAFGVPTHDPWTRVGETHSLMYFRDPSGNQFEMFCPEGDTGLTLRIGNRAGGDYVIPFPTLVYERLRDSIAEPPLPRVAPLKFNHMTVATKDLGQSRRFFTEIFGAKVAFELSNHVTVVVGGFEIGYGGPTDGGWPDPAAEYPNYTLRIAPDELIPMKNRLMAFGVPTSDIWTSNRRDASIYYRDPTGNLWHLCCEQEFVGAVQRRPGAGGDYVPDLKALCYDEWNDPGR